MAVETVSGALVASPEEASSEWEFYRPAGFLLLLAGLFPRLYRELQELDELEEIAESVHEQAGEQRADLIRRGVPPKTADELVAELWRNPAGLMDLPSQPTESADEDGD